MNRFFSEIGVVFPYREGLRCLMSKRFDAFDSYFSSGCFRKCSVAVDLHRRVRRQLKYYRRFNELVHGSVEGLESRFRIYKTALRRLDNAPFPSAIGSWNFCDWDCRFRFRPGGVLRARYCDPKIRGINKVDGLTWKVKEILDRARVAASGDHSGAAS